MENQLADEAEARVMRRHREEGKEHGSETRRLNLNVASAMSASKVPGITGILGFGVNSDELQIYNIVTA